MAKDNSFDIVSETDMQEVENAFNNTEKGLKQRYDLKDSGSKVDAGCSIHVHAPSGSWRTAAECRSPARAGRR